MTSSPPASDQSPGRLSLEAAVHHPDWPGSVSDPAFCARIATAIEACVEFDQPEHAVVAFASDEEVRSLNHRYRGLDKPTNVLSFPAPAVAAGHAAPVHLGDIILGFETVAAEAHDQGIEFEAHVAHLMVHGILHLLGYDHEQAGAAEEMEALEIEILEGLGIANPYTEELVGTG